jgi:hypothetical protein
VTVTFVVASSMLAMAVAFVLRMSVLAVTVTLVVAASMFFMAVAFVLRTSVLAVMAAFVVAASVFARRRTLAALTASSLAARRTVMLTASVLPGRGTFAMVAASVFAGRRTVVLDTRRAITALAARRTFAPTAGALAGRRTAWAAGSAPSDFAKLSVLLLRQHTLEPVDEIPPERGGLFSLLFRQVEPSQEWRKAPIRRGRISAGPRAILARPAFPCAGDAARLNQHAKCADNHSKHLHLTLLRKPMWERRRRLGPSRLPFARCPIGYERQPDRRWRVQGLPGQRCLQIFTNGQTRYRAGT